MSLVYRNRVTIGKMRDMTLSVQGIQWIAWTIKCLCPRNKLTYMLYHDVIIIISSVEHVRCSHRVISLISTHLIFSPYIFYILYIFYFDHTPYIINISQSYDYLRLLLFLIPFYRPLTIYNIYSMIVEDFELCQEFLFYYPGSQYLSLIHI